MWEKTIRHDGLHAYRVVRGQSQHEVDMKARLQFAQWEERWQNKAKLQQNREDNYAGRTIALERTVELERQREVLATLLSEAVKTPTRLDWESLKPKATFHLLSPTLPKSRPLPIAPAPLAPKANVPLPALQLVTPIAPEWTLVEKLLPFLKAKKQRTADALTQTLVANAQKEYQKQLDFKDATETKRRQEEEAFRLAHQEFLKASEEVRESNKKLSTSFDDKVMAWRAAKIAFEREQEGLSRQIEVFKGSYLAREEIAVTSYFYEILAKSQYPDTFPREHLVELTPEKTLILDFELPAPSALPTTKEVKYISVRAAFQEIPLSEAWMKKNYDEVIYQICLRTLWELFSSDTIDAIRSIVFNGWVRSVDRATGSEVHACVMSLESGKDEFLAINLSQVDPRTCFKKLKGVAASKLIELSPVKPLLTISRDDKRFLEGYAVADRLDDRTNLAAMDWLDFENLIREVFGKEFSKGGGEVKITQASRDGGVDAIAFDPNPIRGGKIVIQAKRYTNTVGVSAVRDLYGTVHNEGANKGILVTTSDFGPDAYAFAKDKPITLLSGGELLYLLAQHGHSAKIDLAEAKRIAAEQS